MGKRAARRRMRDDYQEKGKVRALFPKREGWTPLDRDQGNGERAYVRHVKPCSDNQRRLLEAIDKRNQEARNAYVAELEKLNAECPVLDGDPLKRLRDVQ